jgi:hypothetical protein
MEGESSRYVNSGTWTTMPGWRERPTPYVHITLGREPSCRLLDWQRMAQVSSAG